MKTLDTGFSHVSRDETTFCEPINYKFTGLRFSPVCQAQAGRSDDFLRDHRT